MLADSGEGRRRRLRTGFEELQNTLAPSPSREGVSRSPLH